MEHLVNLFPLKLDDMHLSDVTEPGLYRNQEQMGRDVRNR